MRYGVTVPPAPVRSITDHPAPQPGGPEEEEDLRRRELLRGEPPDTIEEETNNVIDSLLKESGDETDCYKLIRIEGHGSVGKTTIARKVYEHPSVVSSFDHAVWINNGGLNREYHEVRREIEQQLALQPRVVNLTQGDEELDYFEHLSGKRILIVLDAVDEHVPTDLVGPSRTGDEVSYNKAPLSAHLCVHLYYAFNKGYNARVDSAVIMTGGYFSGHLSAYVHWHKPVDIHEFRCETRPKFFRNRAFALARCQGSQLLAVLVKCYQDIFAAQLFLRLLYVNPHRSTTELETICRALEKNKNNTAKAMLMFCYSELPSHYKSCLMYLSIFPQRHITMRTDLLRRWAAEGLITKRRAVMGTVDDQAERIFDSLVTRGFICPVETSAAGKTIN
jgi:hypothetical protein